MVVMPHCVPFLCMCSSSEPCRKSGNEAKELVAAQVLFLVLTRRDMLKHVPNVNFLSTEGGASKEQLAVTEESSSLSLMLCCVRATMFVSGVTEPKTKRYAGGARGRCQTPKISHVQCHLLSGTSFSVAT